MSRRFALICSALFFLCSLASAYDFGMFLSQEAGYGGPEGGGDFDYSIGLAPRVSGVLGEAGNFIVTAGLEADYSGHPGRGGWDFVPELLRTGLSFRPGDWACEIGRMYHCDPLGFVADGLFDGAKIEYTG
jgi:hypothetical protein